MVFEHPLNFVHVGLDLGVLGLHLVEARGGLFEEAEDALGLLVGVEALELADKIGDHAADLAHILGAHLVERGLAEIADLLLAGRAVLQHKVCVGDIDLFGKVVHHLLLLGAQRGLLDLDRLGLGGLGLLFGLGLLGGGVEGEGGGDGLVKRQGRGQVFFHGVPSFPRAGFGGALGLFLFEMVLEHIVEEGPPRGTGGSGRQGGMAEAGLVFAVPLLS